MDKFTNKDLKIIEKYCGYEYASRYIGIKKRKEDKMVRIVNTGMVSSGKSSLFNILTGSLEEEHFPTGAARTTIRSNYYDVGNISYIDTPGIDVRTEDDALAFSTILEADIILMIHNIKTGPLNRSESEWLENIVARMNSIEMCKSRMIFVCTWKDTREKDEDYPNIIKDVKEQVYKITGTEIPFFEVSVTKYLSGVDKKKDVLIKNSGIVELQHHLHYYADSYIEKKKIIDNKELDFLVKEINDKLKSVQSKKQEEATKTERSISDRFKSRKSTWKQISNLFSVKREKLKQLEDELRCI